MRTILIGGILSLLSFLILPLFLVSGYNVRVLRASAMGEERPVFSNWGNLIVDGLKAFIIGLVYISIPSAILIGSALLVSDQASSGETVAFFIGLIVLLVAFYFLPASLVNFAIEGQLGAAFNSSAIIRTVRSWGYFVGWLTAVVVTVGGSIVAGILAIIPILGWIAAVPLTFYTSIAAGYVFGRSVANARSITPSTGSGIKDSAETDSDLADRLVKLQELRQLGLLTDSEYQTKRQKLIEKRIQNRETTIVPEYRDTSFLDHLRRLRDAGVISQNEFQDKQQDLRPAAPPSKIESKTSGSSQNSTEQFTNLAEKFRALQQLHEHGTLSDKEYNAKQGKIEPNPKDNSSVREQDVSESLENLKNLHQLGVFSDEEFEEKKRKLLS